MATNQTDPDLNRGLPSKLYWLRCANDMRFTEGVMFTENNALLKIMFINEENTDFLPRY